MNKHSKKLLSALLVIAMMASLLVVPAGAAGVGTKWDFLNKGSSEGFTDESFAGVTVDGEFQSGYGAKLANGQTIVFPVDGDCDIKVHVKHNWKVWINDDSANAEEHTSGGGDEVVTFHYAGGAGNVTLNTGTMSWVADIELATYSAPVASLELNMDAVTMKVGEDAATVNATVKNGTVTAWEAISDSSGVATATVADGLVSITPVAEGAATVTVKATVEGVDDPLSADIAVTVDPAGAYTSWDFTGADFQASAPASYKGLTISGGKAGGAANGVAFFSADNASIAIPVDGPCTIFVVTSYNWDLQLGDDATTRDTAPGDGSASKTVEFSYTGEAGTATVKALNGRTWVKSIELKYPEPPVVSADKRIHVWDIAGKAETDTSLYTNHITPATWGSWASTLTGDALAFAKGGGTVTVKGNPYTTKGGEIPDYQTKGIDLDGLILYTANASSNQCSIFSTVTSDDWGNFKPQSGSLVNTFADGYVSAGGYMTYGAGGASRRFIKITGVKAGETVVAYLGNNQTAITFGVDGVEDATLTLEKNAYGVLSFIAPKDGDYKIYEPANANKPAYLRVMVVPPVTVSGSVTLPSGFDATGWGLKFVDPETKAETLATVNNDNTYTVELAPGHTYNASLTGANGWGMTLATKQVAPAQGDITTGKTHNMVVEAKSQYTYSGTITGFAAGYDTSKLAITLIPDEDSKVNAGAEDVDLTLSGMDFTAVLEPSVVYALELEGANDYNIKTPAEVTSEGVDLAAQSIVVEPKTLVAASGKFVTLDVDDQFAPIKAGSTYAPLTATVTKLTFQNVEDGYTYDATIADGGYTANLRAGAYEAVATVDGYATKTHVVVGNKAVSKDLLFVSTAAPGGVDYAADIYVDGVGGTDLHFKTVTGAMAYIKRMTRSDTQRVTVHIAPGTYREQISIDSKNVTFVNDTPSKEVKLTWYYGIGYTYYSATGTSSTDSWYDAELAFDRYSKPVINVARWGCTVRVQAPGFQADGITFENSFNRELVDEEIVDGAEPNGKESIRVAREYGVDVTSRAATERAAVLWVDTNNGRGDMTEFKNCRFLSSQDTLVTGKRMYFKDCYIEGMTDYICGPGDVVFDTCTLNWKGYSESTQGGYVTAPQTTASETGYLFRNCYISGDTKLQLGAGALGRTWGCSDTGCIFLNTTLQSASVLTDATWVLMQNLTVYPNFTSLDQLTKVTEWGTALADANGTKVDLSKRAQQNTVATSEPTVDVKGTYFKSWVPEYYAEEAQGVALAAAPAISDNGDINLPRPGHTLSVAYALTPEGNNANDASTIQWYRVAADGAETLVKTATAPAGKTYQIQEADVGAQIKVTVTPKTMGGQTGEPMSSTVDETVKEGYDDPSQVVDPVLGAGVNVFLAGDSTVKDYSAAGMETDGKNQAEGSWGEWLQQFFNDKVTVVDYAQGGRTTRQFIEDGRLGKIDAAMKEGDFLFIQFGHNDCHTQDNRYVPLGIAKNDPQKSYAEGGVYPDTVTTTSNLMSSTDSTKVALAAGTHTTYTGYLKEYLAVAKKHNATAVLMTPVARLYYSNGKIRPHHDATAFDGTSDNEYCKAVKWVYDWALDNGYENNVLFLDNFQLTVDLFETAYADGGNDTYGRQLMNTGDATHNSKLGGLIEAAVIAQAIQNSDMTIAKAVKAPTQVTSKTPDDETAFTITGAGVLAAYDILTGFADHATYWEGKGQKLFDAIAAKAAELNGGSTNPDDPTKPVDKTALNKAVADAEKALAAATVAEDGAEIATNRTWITAADKEALEAAIAAAKALGDDATEAQVSNALKAVNDAAKAIKAGEKPAGGSTSRPSGSGSTVATTTPSTTTVTNPDGTVATATTDKDGNVDITVKGEDGEVLAEVKLPATIAAPETKFVDVPDGHWAAKAINDMAGLGMVKGVSEDTYDMVSPMTRGSIATIFYRLSNGKEGKPTTFADVSENAWYADAVGWAASSGVVNGYSETAFGPDDTITRQQLAVMIARYARLLGLDTTAEQTALAAFSDGSAAGSWAADSLAWCVKNGVMKGRGGNVLDPTAAVTRAEAAVMLDRMIELIK